MVKILGVTIQERISQGKWLDVYKARRDADERPLVVKIQREDVTVPEYLINRWQIGMELHAKVRHTNVILLLDHGTVDGFFYSVEPAISGPSMADQIERGVSIRTVLAQLSAVARGLESMHVQGVVHADVKPEHILLRNNGTPQLIDFSCASPVGEPAPAPLMGTPGYMPPEQMSGKALDGRTDVFALGVVLYRVMVGQMPYAGLPTEDSRTPKLPDHLQEYQPFFDRALSVDLNLRYQTAADFADTLIAMAEHRKSAQQVPRVRTQDISTAEVRSIRGDVLMTPLDMGRQQQKDKKNARQRRLRNVAAAGLVLIAVLAGGYYLEERQILTMETLLTSLGLTEDPQLANAWNDAQSLRQDPNQGLSAIVAAYQRVLSLAPDHQEAQTELANLEVSWQASIDEALLQGNLEAAQTRLEEGLVVFDEDLDWLQLQNELTNRQRAERIVVSTASLLASHGLSDLPSATAAIQSYQEVLRLAPNHPGALQALRDLSEHYAQLASEAVVRGELSEGISLLERATAADGNVPMLDDVRTLISRATTARAAIDDLLQQARRLRAEGQLMLPPGENAAELYHRVLATDPQNVIAAQGLDEITAQVAAQTDALLLEGQISQVEVLVSQAQAAGLVDVGVAEMRRRLDAEKTRLQTITDNLELARGFMQFGYLTAPPQDNAVAKLREVQQVDPGNNEAIELLQQCAQRLASVALEAHEYGMVDDAKQYLDLAMAITPEVESWIALRESWEDG